MGLDWLSVCTHAHTDDENAYVEWIKGRMGVNSWLSFEMKAVIACGLSEIQFRPVFYLKSTLPMVSDQIEIHDILECSNPKLTVG